MRGEKLGVENGHGHEAVLQYIYVERIEEHFTEKIIFWLYELEIVTRFSLLSERQFVV